LPANEEASDESAGAETKRSASQWHRDLHATFGAHPPFIEDVGSGLLGGGRPGQSGFVVREVTLGDPAEERTMVDGAVVTMGIPLREFRETLGGDEGEWEHPATGEPVHISLKKWVGRDPETTLLQLMFTFSPNE
jgi:hypothetical protein